MIVTLSVFFAAILAVSFVGAMLGAHFMWVHGYRPKDWKEKYNWNPCDDCDYKSNCDGPRCPPGIHQ